MSDLQDIIASSSIRAFNQGVILERERVLRVLESVEAKTSWDFEQKMADIIKEVRGEQK
jgi:hypothetical protein